jgi:hypothetical protein
LTGLNFALEGDLSVDRSAIWPTDCEENPMKKALLALAAASSIAVATIAIPSTADAKCTTGCAVGIGVGAFALGTVVGAGAAGPPPGYGYGGYAPAPGYAAYSGYYQPAPVGCPGGYWARRPLYDQWGNQVGWSRPKFFCPY